MDTPPLDDNEQVDEETLEEPFPDSPLANKSTQRLRKSKGKRRASATQSGPAAQPPHIKSKDW